MEKQQMREKLVELLRVHPCDNVDCEKCDEFQDGCWLGKLADKLICNGVTFAEDNNVPTKWISVKDRLPQDDLPFGALCEIVQVLLDDGTVTVGWCNRGWKCWYYMPINATSFVGHDYDKTPVVAWQPLAQPPKGE